MVMVQCFDAHIMEYIGALVQQKKNNLMLIPGMCPPFFHFYL